MFIKQEPDVPLTYIILQSDDTLQRFSHRLQDEKRNKNWVKYYIYIEKLISKKPSSFCPPRCARCFTFLPFQTLGPKRNAGNTHDTVSVNLQFAQCCRPSCFRRCFIRVKKRSARNKRKRILNK